MKRWLMAFGLAGVLAGGVSAQAQIQIQVQAQPGQAQPQVQILPAQPGGAGGAAVQPLPGRAKMLPTPPIVNNQPRFMQADAIFVGRVVAIEPMDVEAAPAAGQANVKYRVAVVKVSESIFGLKKDAETVRVAFQAQPNNGGGNLPGGGVQVLPAIQPLPPNGGPAIGRRPFYIAQLNLTVGQDGLFAVSKHHKENFYLSPTYTNFVNRENNPAFDGEVKNAKSLAKVMGDPAAALKSDDKESRFLAAAVLVSKYRAVNNPTGAAMKQEPIDAEESKLILKAIAGGDWTVGRFNQTVPTPFELFNQLGINQKDGYNPTNIRTQQDIAQAMQKWLDENQGKYRINKMVPDPNAKAAAPQPGGQPANPPIAVPPPGVNVRPGVRPLPPVPAAPPAPAPAPNDAK